MQAASRCIALLLVVSFSFTLFAQTPPRPEATAGLRLESADRSEDFREVFAALKWPTRVGPLIGRVSHAKWFGEGTQVEAELYPKLGERVYAYTSVAIGEGDIYPDLRVGGEVFAGFGEAWETSAGFRYLDFETDRVTVWTGSIAKYIGNWYGAVRIYDTSNSGGALQVNVRRYFGDGTEWVGVRAGEGRDEIRSGIDLTTLDAREIAIESRFNVRGPWFAELRGGVGDGDRGDRVTAAAALGRRF